MQPALRPHSVGMLQQIINQPFWCSGWPGTLPPEDAVSKMTPCWRGQQCLCLPAHCPQCLHVRMRPEEHCQFLLPGH